MLPAPRGSFESPVLASLSLLRIDEDLDLGVALGQLLLGDSLAGEDFFDLNFVLAALLVARFVPTVTLPAN